MLTPINPRDVRAKMQCYLEDLGQVAGVVDVWLHSMAMTYPLHSALEAVWNIVSIEVPAIQKELLSSKHIHDSILEASSHLDKTEVLYSAWSEAKDSKLRHTTNQNGKRQWTPQEDERVIANIPRRSACLSATTQKPPYPTSVVWDDISQSPIRNSETKKTKTDSPPKICPSSRESQPENLIMSSTAGVDPPESHSQEIALDLVATIQEVRELDPLPSSIPIGVASDYIASEITQPCRFPCPSEYNKGELWEKIDTEFLRVMGKDLLARGDLRRGKFGVLGIVEWILDAREHASWDNICEEMALQKFITLRDHLKMAVLHSHNTPVPSTDLVSPSSSTTTLVQPEPPATPSKLQNKFCLTNSKSRRLDTVMATHQSSSSGTSQQSLHLKRIICKHRHTGSGMYGAIRMPRSVTPPSDTEAESAAQSDSSSQQTITENQHTRSRMYGAIRVPRSATPLSDDEGQTARSNNETNLNLQKMPDSLGPNVQASIETTYKTHFTSRYPQLLIEGPTHMDPTKESVQLTTFNSLQYDNHDSISDQVQTPATSKDDVSNHKRLQFDHDQRGRRKSPVSHDPSSSGVFIGTSSHQSPAPSQTPPLTKSPLWVQKIDIYYSISVEKNNIQPIELVEIRKATQVLLGTLIRGSCTDFNPDELLRQPVTFSSLGQPGIRQWCEQPENRELFTPSLETLWYKPKIFNINTIEKSDPPESISRHERFLWNTLKNFCMPSANFVERGMHYVLAAVILIGSDAEEPHCAPDLPKVSSMSEGARTAFSCWHHYKTLSSLRWAKIEARRAEAADGCLEDLDKLIAIIYTMVETFASIWASTSLKADIEATEKLIKGSQSLEEIQLLTSGLEHLQKACSQIKVEYSNLPALVGFLCSGVKGLMIYPTDIRVFSPLRALNFLLVTSHLAQSDQSISEPIWKRTQSYIVGFLKAVTHSTEEWVPQELNRYHLARALFLDFSDYFISRNMTKIPIPKCRNYKVNDQTYF